MKISEIVKNIEGCKVEGEDKDITGFSYNTSNVEKESLFFCIVGVKTDGHIFAQKAVDSGAIAIVISKDVDIKGDVTKIFVKDTREAMALMSSNFYENPSLKMDMIGITGTNGKTTSTFMMKSIFDTAGKTTGLFGTIYNIFGDEREVAKRTTPESMDLQRMLMRMEEKGVDTCIMEVSSHSLELKRTYGIKYRVGIFTNLTQDHLDFHGTMENYFNAKKKLYESCTSAAINIDDEYGQRLSKEIECKCITYGIENKADLFASDIEVTSSKSSFKMHYRDEVVVIDLKLPGKFNVYNALGCAAAALEMGISLAKIKEGLELLESVPGRSEKVTSKRGFTLVIDYAHTPDGLINILKTAREYTKGRLIALFGCGGDRDKTKRPLMGKAAGELADFCIVTSDNPRTEVPGDIIQDILPGINETQCDYVIIEDRKNAIKYAIDNGKKGDVIVIAGKGHETYQVLADKTIHFDEREIVFEFLEEDM